MVRVAFRVDKTSRSEYVSGMRAWSGPSGCDKLWDGCHRPVLRNQPATVIGLKLYLLLLFAALGLCAQTTAATGSIRGIALDPTGMAIPGVRIIATQQETRSLREAQSGAGGHFFLGNLAIGAYVLRMEAPGFAVVTAGPITVSVGQVVEQRISMQPAGLVEKLEVTDQPEAIDVGAPTASVVLGGERIEESPARSRNYLNFVLTAPGVAPSAASSSQRTMTGIRTPLGDSGFTFGGMRPRNNAILIDGMDNRDETTGGNRVAVGLEMVQEFRVAGTAIGAELGGAAGGLLNMVTRSGVNVWHGDFTIFGQNELWNAQRPELDAARKPRFRRYQPGASVLGPVKRDRTFFATAIEYERESAEEWSAVPGAAVESVDRALLQPEFARAATPRVLRGLYGTGTRGTELSGKFSHQQNNKDTLAARYAFSRGRVQGEVQGPDNFADRSAQGNSLTTDHSLVGNWLHVATPTLVNELRVQVAERRMELRPNAAGAMLEIPGVATLGEHYRLNADRTERHYQLVESFNVVAASHRLSMGADIHWVGFDAELRNRFQGIYLFPTLGAFQSGRPDVFVQAFGEAAKRMTTVPLGFWLQDRWETRPGLHLELGLRYDRQRMPAGLPPSGNNLSPRLGVSWRPSAEKPLLIRAGAGLFYDRFPLAYLNDAVQKNGRSGFEQYATGDDAVRAFRIAQAGTLTAPLPGVARGVYEASSPFSSTYGRKFSLGVEHGLGAHTSLAVEANYLRGFHLPRLRNASGTAEPRWLLEQSARSEYVGGSISLNRRLHNDLAYLLTYNIGRTRDDASDFDEHPLDPRQLRQDWARSRQHQTHRLAISALFELPAEELGMPDWLGSVFEDLSFAPILTLGSRRPINALLTTDVYRTGAYPLSARPLGLGRNPYWSPSTASLDLRLMKTYKVKQERALLQFGVESFNLTNHSNTDRVSQYYATPQGRLANYGATLESLPARQLQLFMQLEY